jgi:ArsR family transcriptional regulator, arsenate/arsenite/antimonite-responsive transcriptional repressor
MILGMDSNLVVRALSALAHESRLAIFRALVVAGPDGLPAGEIVKHIGIQVETEAALAQIRRVR